MTLELLRSIVGIPLRQYLYQRPIRALTIENGSSMDNCLRACSMACKENASCVCPCLTKHSHISSFMAAFASISYILLVVAVVQLVLCMVTDALSDDKPDSKLKKAFRVTIQKCLLGAVIWATGTRAIYFTIQNFIPEEWADILLNLYYPGVLFALSLLICFWAEVFYHSLPADGHDFIMKDKYSLGLTIFNVLVYLLLMADVIATPLVKDEKEQARKSGIISSIFAFLLFMMLVGFLHLSIRLFFRPDWQPLFARLQVLRINMKQQVFSCAGIISNAVMQCLIIILLVLNMVSRFQKVDSYSLYVCAIIIRITELCVPIWFCCSLWNYKQPKRLWILNPTLLLRNFNTRHKVSDSESTPILESQSSDYGTFPAVTADPAGSKHDADQSQEDEGYCWICLDEGDPQDLFYPCKCRLHRQCLKTWLTARASNTNISEREYMKCQCCREKYHAKKYSLDGCLCFTRGLDRKDWSKILGLIVALFLSALLLVYVACSPLSSGAKIATICCIVAADAILLKLAGFGLMRLQRRNRASVADIVGRPAPATQQQDSRERQTLTESNNDLRTRSMLTSSAGESSVEVHEC